ncbi:MAG: hypothetical protein QOE08_1562, partial [Thermoleophilaceae bacterium]|nr:hypothetical protein [Thermoleophilaceae bacterium]
RGENGAGARAGRRDGGDRAGERDGGTRYVGEMSAIEAHSPGCIGSSDAALTPAPGAGARSR